MGDLGFNWNLEGIGDMENNRVGEVGAGVKGSFGVDGNFKWDSLSGPT